MSAKPARSRPTGREVPEEADVPVRAAQQEEGRRLEHRVGHQPDAIPAEACSFRHHAPRIVQLQHPIDATYALAGHDRPPVGPQQPGAVGPAAGEGPLLKLSGIEEHQAGTSAREQRPVGAKPGDSPSITRQTHTTIAERRRQGVARPLGVTFIPHEELSPQAIGGRVGRDRHQLHPSVRQAAVQVHRGHWGVGAGPHYLGLVGVSIVEAPEEHPVARQPAAAQAVPKAGAVVGGALGIVDQGGGAIGAQREPEAAAGGGQDLRTSREDHRHLADLFARRDRRKDGRIWLRQQARTEPHRWVRSAQGGHPRRDLTGGDPNGRVPLHFGGHDPRRLAQGQEREGTIAHQILAARRPTEPSEARPQENDGHRKCSGIRLRQRRTPAHLEGVGVDRGRAADHDQHGPLIGPRLRPLDGGRLHTPE